MLFEKFERMKKLYLIHITSLKRKISSDLESVGEDIDVALISKGDGFIWKKKENSILKQV